MSENKKGSANLKRYKGNFRAQRRYKDILKEHYPKEYQKIINEEQRKNNLKNNYYIKIFAQ